MIVKNHTDAYMRNNLSKIYSKEVKNILNKEGSNVGGPSFNTQIPLFLFNSYTANLFPFDNRMCSEVESLDLRH